LNLLNLLLLFFLCQCALLYHHAARCKYPANAKQKTYQFNNINNDYIISIKIFDDTTKPISSTSNQNHQTINSIQTSKATTNALPTLIQHFMAISTIPTYAYYAMQTSIVKQIISEQ